MSHTPNPDDARCPFDDPVPTHTERWASSWAAADEALGDHDRFGRLPSDEWPGPE
jgi:hypothetical protein